MLKKTAKEKKPLRELAVKSFLNFCKIDYDPSQIPVMKVSYADVLSRPLFYPENSFAIGLSFLIGKKTFTKNQIMLLRDMGFTVDVCIRNREVPEAFQ